MTHLERCIAVMQAINVTPQSYDLPGNLLTLLRNAIYNTPYHYPTEQQLHEARAILTRCELERVPTITPCDARAAADAHDFGGSDYT
jgi:hypothetical protein